MPSLSLPRRPQKGSTPKKLVKEGHFIKPPMLKDVHLGRLGPGYFDMIDIHTSWARLCDAGFGPLIRSVSDIVKVGLHIYAHLYQLFLQVHNSHLNSQGKVDKKSCLIRHMSPEKPELEPSSLTS